MSFASLLRSIVGDQVGLDKADNLLLKGTQIHLDHMGSSPSILEAIAGGLYINGNLVGSGGGGTSVDITLSAAQQNLVVSDVVTRVCLTPAAGGSTWGGMSAPASDDAVKALVNMSSTDGIEITNQDAGTTSPLARFFVAPGTTIGPGQMAIARYVKTRWRIL